MEMTLKRKKKLVLPRKGRGRGRADSLPPGMVDQVMALARREEGVAAREACRLLGLNLDHPDCLLMYKVLGRGGDVQWAGSWMPCKGNKSPIAQEMRWRIVPK